MRSPCALFSLVWTPFSLRTSSLLTLVGFIHSFLLSPFYILFLCITLSPSVRVHGSFFAIWHGSENFFQILYPFYLFFRPTLRLAIDTRVSFWVSCKKDAAFTCILHWNDFACLLLHPPLPHPFSVGLQREKMLLRRCTEPFLAVSHSETTDTEELFGNSINICKHEASESVWQLQFTLTLFTFSQLTLHTSVNI